MSEDDLLTRASEGDAEALDALWRAHRPWIAAILLGHMPAGASLDDLLQEVALIVVKRLNSLRERAALRPWLRTVTLNVARGEGRRRSLRSRALSLSGNEAELVDEVGARQLAAKEELLPVLAAARELPEEYREPLLLKALQGLSQREIADILGVPVTTVESRLARARRMLRRALQPSPLAPPSAPGLPAQRMRQ